jgi:hypothetical protein
VSRTEDHPLEYFHPQEFLRSVELTGGGRQLAKMLLGVDQWTVHNSSPLDYAEELLGELCGGCL